jgi:dienelactone hydrolase
MARKIALFAAVAGLFAGVFTSGCNINVEPPEGGPTTTSASSGNSGAGGGGGGSDGSGGGAATTGGTGTGTPDASRCTATPQQVWCPYEKLSLPAKLGAMRDVVWQVPLGAAPAQGWRVVLLFQGSFYGPPLMFDASDSSPHGGYHLASTVKALLDAGYAVVAPAAHVEGGLFWDTNVPPWTLDWTASPDHAFMLSIFAAISSGKFGPLDASRMYATGISSGGYMTSRMAVSYPGKFRALAVHSGSYASCSGPLCIVPDTLPSDHPPTLFLHGDADLIVPISTMKPYNARLVEEGKETRVVIGPGAGHEWLAAGPQEVVSWFDAHP